MLNFSKFIEFFQNLMNFSKPFTIFQIFLNFSKLSSIFQNSFNFSKKFCNFQSPYCDFFNSSESMKFSNFPHYILFSVANWYLTFHLKLGWSYFSKNWMWGLPYQVLHLVQATKSPFLKTAQKNLFAIKIPIIFIKMAALQPLIADKAEFWPMITILDTN